MKSKKLIVFLSVSLVAVLAALLLVVAFPPAYEADEKDRGLFYAVKRGDAFAVNTALTNGANPNARDENGIPALWWATIQTNGKIVNMLLDAGADVNLGGEKNWQDLIFGNDKIADAFIAEKIDVNAANENGMPLIWAAGLNGEFANILIELGADVNVEDKEGWTPLMWAAFQGNGEVANVLLAAGADVNAADKDGWTPLMWAENSEVVNALLAAGVDVNGENEKGLTALMTAGNGEVANALLAAGADVNAADKDGWTPLMGAAFKGHSEVVNILLAAGADVNALDKKEQAVLWWAKQGLIAKPNTPEGVKKKAEHKETIAILKDAGAKICAVVDSLGHCVTPWSADMKNGGGK